MMTEIKPFPGIIYKYDRVRKPQKLICPPYDIITPDQARVYRQLSCYNMVNLILPEGGSGQKQYQKASCCFNDWLKRGILLHDKEPAIYFYQQEYQLNKKKFKRLGFIACLSLNSSTSIYGHEHTYIEPKEDRLKLLIKVRANLEPIFVLFSDSKRYIRNIFEKYVQSSKPMLYFHDREKTINTLWRLTSPTILKKIIERMTDKVVFIADGHHRYEVSLNYQEMLRKGLKKKQGRKDFDFIMAYFCFLQSPGLIIKSVHRLVKGVDSIPMDKFRKFFNIHKTNRREFFVLMQSVTSKRRMIGMYNSKNFYILILKSSQFLSKINDKDYRRLDICLLNHLVLNELLGLKPEDKKRIIFDVDVRELMRQADAKRTSFAFFLKPPKISDIIYLAKAGKKLPAKTTYFYPKVPSGLVIYKFNEDTAQHLC